MASFFKNLFSTPQRSQQQAMTLLDFIAPPAIKVGPNYIKIGEKLARSYFVFSFPRYLSTGWLSPIVNLDVPMDLSIFLHPIDTGLVLKQLRKKVTEIQSEIMEREEKGLIRDPVLETAYRDVETLRDKLQTAQERMFDVGIYITVYADTEKELEKTEATIRAILESRLVYIKPMLYQQEKGFVSTSPYGLDQVKVHTRMNTSPLSTLFPFVSFDLSSNEGILYGINQHNNSLVLFDRFTLENANMVVFGKSGGGKSILGDEPVIIKENGKIRMERIGDLVEGLIKKHSCQKIDNDLEGVINPGIEVWSFNQKLKASWSKVSVAARKKAPDVFYKFKTRSGREITTTGDHNMLILKNGKVVVTKSSQVNKGDYIPLPHNIVTDSALNSLNLLSLLKNSKNIYVLGAEEIIKKVNPKIWNQKIDKKFDRYLHKYASGRPIPLSYFLKILKFLDISLDDSSLQKIKIVSRDGRTDYTLPCSLPANMSLARLLGFIMTKGEIKDNSIIIFSRDKEIIRKIEKDFQNLGISFYRTKNSIKCLNRVFVEIVKTLSKRGKSPIKRIPSFIFELPQKSIAQFLSAYFESVGNIEHNQICVKSESEGLVSEMSYLLYYFGIVAKIQRKRIANKSKFYWQIIIFGKENLEKFQKNIGFVSQKKKQLLERIVKRKKNTNEDYIPNLDPLFKKLYQINPDFFASIPEISLFKKTTYNLSRKKLKSIIAKIERRVSIIENFLAQVQNFSNIRQINHFINSNTHCRFLTGLTQNLINSTAPSEKIINLYLQIEEIKSILNQLKTFFNSDLIFDPIVEIKKIKNRKEKYVYDLTVDNEVFLAGKGGMFVHNSYAVKLEILRYLMLGVDVIVIDPENEYKFLCDAVGGGFYDISLKSPNHINPFDLPEPLEDETPEEVLRSNIINLVGLLRLMLGGLTPEEDSIIEQAITETYAARDITEKTDPKLWPERLPLLSDLESVLETMEGAESLVQRLRKFTKGVYSGFFNYPTNVKMEKNMVVFGIKNLEPELRPMAMYIIMRYIWNTIKGELKKRILVIDEAWWLMQNEDSASFLFGIVKRGRKYWLGTTTITQDVNDFMKSEYGQPIITNSSLQLLMKQSPATIAVVQKTFNLTDNEKDLLLEAPVGEGIFFAGEKHVAIRVVASYAEHQIITTSPEEVAKIKKLKKLKE